MWKTFRRQHYCCLIMSASNQAQNLQQHQVGSSSRPFYIIDGPSQTDIHSTAAEVQGLANLPQSVGNFIRFLLVAL